MTRALLILLVCLTPAFSIDKGMFKDCSRVPFCANMRHQEVEQYYQYSADISSYTETDNVIIIPLRNSNGNELDLQISVLSGSKARVKVLEKDHSRYELQDVLDKEFAAISTSRTTNDNTLSLTSEEDSNFVINVKGSAPFSVEFLYNNEVELVLRGDRLVMNSNDDNQAFSFDVAFNGARKLYGLHHHAYKLGLDETADNSQDPFHLRNFDAAGYETGSTMAVYGSVPVVYGQSAQWTSGVFLHNAAQQWIDISYSENNPTAYFMVESATFDLFVMMGPTTKELVRQFTDLTGKAHLPQLWVLGYHQCRYSYQTQEDVKDVVANMDNYDFPMDAIWLDIDYTDEKKYFTWHPENYNDPEEMQRNLSSTNRKLVTIIDPHYKVDDNYEVYTGGRDANLFVKWADGSNYEDQCWPGLSVWFDFLNPEARDYYASWFSYDKFKGSTETLAGIWNDMNEPAVFDGSYENTMPSEAVHVGNVLHRDVHNIYGFLQTKATHQGLMQRDNGNKRPFVLTRSHFAGSQRYAAMWTGDNNAGWNYLAITYPECINSNMLGMVLCGGDIGGFSGNPEDELMLRWYQAAVWLPFFRQHSNNNVNRREPYLFYDEMQTVVRKAMKLRYKHLPVYYTLSYEHTRYGDPIVRPFFYDFPEVEERDDHVLVGSDILARPVLEGYVNSVWVVLPGANTYWYRVDDDSWSVHKGDTSEELEVNISISPYYYRAGSIVTRKERERGSTTDMRDDPVTLYVNLDESGNAQGRYYQDDYESFKYSTDNDYLYINFTYDSSSNGVQISIIDGNSNEYAPVLQEIIVHRISEGTAGVESRHTTNSDGIPLNTLDIAGHFNKMRSNEMMILL